MRSTLSCEGTPIKAVNMPDYSIPVTVMWEPPCYYWALSGPESSHSLSCGRRWALTWLQGNMPAALTWDQPIPDPDLVLYINGTSLVKQGQWLSGYAVVMEETIVEASSLPSHWPAQQAKLYAVCNFHLMFKVLLTCCTKSATKAGPLSYPMLVGNPNLGTISLCRTKSQNCTACSQVNAASQHIEKPPGIQVKGTLPFEHLEVDFTEMKPHWHYHYLLVIICTFSGCVEAFPTRTERASKVAWCLLREIVTRFLDFLPALDWTMARLS